MRFLTSPVPQDLNPFMSVFLAGSIEQGKARPWHGEVAEALSEFSDGLVVLNPRRETWDATLVQDIDNPVFKAQVNWEIDGIDDASIVFFYFQEGTLSPITLLEFGYAIRTNGCVVVCEPGFWRRGNIQVMVERCKDFNGDVFLYDNMQDGVSKLKDMIQAGMQYENW